MGNTRSFCVSLSSCERNIVSSTQINQTFIYEEKNTIAKESFKMSTEDLKLSHQVYFKFIMNFLCVFEPSENFLLILGFPSLFTHKTKKKMHRES